MSDECQVSNSLGEPLICITYVVAVMHYAISQIPGDLGQFMAVDMGKLMD